MSEKVFERREFIKKWMQGSLLILSAPILKACQEEWLYPPYFIKKERCIGCGECLKVCYYSAIVLPKLSSYSIKKEECTNCGICEGVCKFNAIDISAIDYFINIEKCNLCGKCLPFCSDNAISLPTNSLKYAISTACVGCGDCVTVCEKEGKAITYKVRYYSVINTKCTGCIEKCSSVCPVSGAITKKSNKAVINTSLCIKCGKCLTKCDRNAITPSSVVLDQDKCTKCGKCYSVCTYSGITKTGEMSQSPPQIDHSKCTRCAKCIAECPENAIYTVAPIAVHDPILDMTKCTSCGDCYVECPESAIKRDLKNADINQTMCYKCGKCMEVCPESAISR
jgi:energy-converting hydrogenase B subunit K